MEQEQLDKQRAVFRGGGARNSSGLADEMTSPINKMDGSRAFLLSVVAGEN